MTLRRIVLATLLSVTLAPFEGASASEPDGTEPEVAPASQPTLWLRGPFGRVPGGDPADPAAAAPAGAALDTWTRSAPLTLESDVPFEERLEVRVVSRPAEEGAPEEVLSEGTMTFPGPDRPGLAVIVATMATDTRSTSERAWLVDVPDREWSEEALFDIPGPEIELVGELGVVTGAPLNGCYAYLCSEVGNPPPVEALEPLVVHVGETLVARPSDGSALLGWQGMLTPAGRTHGRGIEAVGVLTDTPEAVLPLAALAVPGAGEWRLELRVDYDRERGWQWVLYRLVAEPGAKTD